MITDINTCSYRPMYHLNYSSNIYMKLSDVYYFIWCLAQWRIQGAIKVRKIDLAASLGPLAQPPIATLQVNKR